MKYYELLEGVEIALRNTPFSKSGRWFLIYYAKTFQAVPKNLYINQAPKLLEFGEVSAERGFSLAEWNEVAVNLKSQLERI